MFRLRCLTRHGNLQEIDGLSFACLRGCRYCLVDVSAMPIEVKRSAGGTLGCDGSGLSSE